MPRPIPGVPQIRKGRPMGRMEAVGRFIRAAVYNIRIKGVRRCFARALNTAAEGWFGAAGKAPRSFKSDAPRADGADA